MQIDGVNNVIDTNRHTEIKANVVNPIKTGIKEESLVSEKKEKGTLKMK